MKSLDYVVLVAALALIAVASAQAIPKDPAPAALAPAPAAPPAATSAAPAAPDADAAKADTPEARRAARIEALKKREAEFRLRQSLRTRRTRQLAVEQTAVKDVLSMLAQWGGFSVVYDPDLEQAGIDLAARSVTLSFTGLTYDDALTLVLPRECGYRVGPGYVLVTTLEKSWVPLRTATYSIRLALAEIPNFEGPHINVGDLTQQAASASGGGGAFGNIFNPPAAESDEGKATPDRIMEIIKKFVRHENDRRIAPWDDEGGPASMSYMNGMLVVSQTDAGHAAVARLIAMIE